MHNSYFTLNQVTRALSEKIAGWQISECYSHRKDELILEFRDRTNPPFFIRADLGNQFTCLSFPENIVRPGKNSADLFRPLIGETVNSLHQYPYERAFHMVVGNNHTLLFKMFGHHANIILFEGEKEKFLFKNNLKADHRITLSGWQREFDLSFDGFRNSAFQPRKFLPVMDAAISNELENYNFTRQNPEDRYAILMEMIRKLENVSGFYIRNTNGNPEFLLFETSPPVKYYQDPLEALEYFYKVKTRHLQFTGLQKQVIGFYQEKKVKYGKYLEQLRIKLDYLEKESDYRVFGDLLMANLHQIKEREKEVELINFYTGKPVKIRLKENLTPSKNAEVYYRKARNQKIQTSVLKKNIRKWEELLHESDKKIEDLTSISEYNVLKKMTKDLGLNPSGKSNENRITPSFKEFMMMDFRILVGRNARNNEELTFGHGHKNDLWLHARDVSGSHVLIKYKAGNNFPQPVIERAAQLAAYYSRYRNNSNCPVIYTERKYVRRKKGGLPGQVLVEKENVILVNPVP